MEKTESRGVEFISAGDIEKYAYCPLSWWLSRKGDVESDDIKRGVEAHGLLEGKLDTVEEKTKGARGYERAVLWVAILSTILSVVGAAMILPSETSHGFILAFLSLIWLLAASYFLYRAETLKKAGVKVRSVEAVITVFSLTAMILALFAVVFVIPSDNKFSIYLEIVSLLWLVGASVFLYLHLSFVAQAEETKKKAGIEEGEVIYHDSSQRKPPILTSRKYGIRGRPDYLLKKDDNIIPVEVKTGRIPRGPLFSHILQLTAYCLLVEEEYNTSPPYGIIRYQNTEKMVEHEIEYTPEMKKLVLDKAEEMRRALRDGVVHRNHRKENKCRYCSRREMCPERLV